MSSDPQRDKVSRRWRTVRIHFRRFRITVLLVLFILVCAGAYLNQVGLPNFVKRPLLSNLRSHGIDLEFSRLRLRGYRGIVAEDVRLGSMDNPALPHFAAASADVKLNYPALARLHLDVLGVTLNKGTLRWQLDPTNEPTQELVITNIMANLRFLPGDQWSLDRLDAEYMGARFYVVGEVTNGSALRTEFRRESDGPPKPLIAKFRKLQQQLDQIIVKQPPEFRLSFTGDGTDLRSFSGLLTVDAPDASTPWGHCLGAQLSVRLDGKLLDDIANAQLTFSANRLETKWATLDLLQLDAAAIQISTNEVECTATLRAAHVTNAWASSSAAELMIEWRHRPNELKPYAGQLDALLMDFSSRWANAKSLRLSVHGHPTTDWMAMDDPALGVWNHLLPYAFELECAATNVIAHNLEAETLGASVSWDAPRLTITNLHGQMAGGRANLDATLDILSRKLGFDGHARMDFHEFNPVLTDKSRAWLDNFTWSQPPVVSMQGALTLPAWTNRAPDWRNEVKPGITLSGHVALTNGSYRGISARSAISHLGYSNRVWHLPDLELTRPEGQLRVSLQSDEITHDYQIELQGQFDPRAIAPHLDEKGQRGLGYFEFTESPWINAEVRGRWYDRDRTWAKADVAWTNVSYRAQHADRIYASLEYSNQVLQVFHPEVHRGNERATADGILFDFASKKAFLTNGYSDTDPMVIATVIGPKTAAAVEPYHFVNPPVARVYGVIPLKGEQEADLHFELAGGPFHWSKFRVPTISGQVHWANETVTLTNIATSFYGGAAQGNAWFDVSERGSTPFHFALTVTNASLHDLMSDLHSPTNQLEGTLTGSLSITNANTADWNSWNGFGRANLKDGLIWDTPIFGVMSSVMNSVVPGIGNSRASDAHGTFKIVNSVIHTSDLDIRASGMRLIYNGTVDFQTRVNARVEAELLRDTWFVGKMVSTALWPVSKLFEYRVTGTLANPNPEPVYLVPKVILAPLHPMKSFKDMFQEPAGNYNALPDYILSPTPEAVEPGTPPSQTPSDKSGK